MKNKTEYRKNTDLTDEINSKYESLAPNCNISNGDEYFNALNWALKQDDIHNIAISGPYGSGKSSVINSYFKSFPNKNTVHISLATFAINKNSEGSEDGECSKDDKRADKTSESLEQQLERGILKHLLYSVDAGKIPNSRYRRIQRKVSVISNIVYSVLIAFVCAVAFGFFFSKQLGTLINNIADNIGSWATYITLILILVSLYFFVMWFRKGYRLREVNIFNNIKFEADNNDNSIFNKNLDEIIHYFESTNTEIVCIEDVDRYDNTNIFVALRELNSIINGYENIDKVVFIYAIKDDMFTEEGERTKFFDFIIPVVPYISSTNSAEILRSKLKIYSSIKEESFYDISDRFVSMISPYISDMRDLICICNEFNIFKETLKGNQSLNLNDEKMLALIIFKNLYPKDFAELEDERVFSIVKTAFRNKGQFIISKAQEINTTKEKEKNRLKSIDAEILKDIKEIKVLMIECLTDFEMPLYRIDVGNNSFKYSEMVSDDFDMESLKNKKLRVYYINSNGSSNSKYIDDIEEFFDSKGENYYERLEDISKGIEESRNSIRTRIKEYEKTQSILGTLSIKNIIQNYGIDFLDESVKNNDLLVFLLRNGYIDETYDNYINYFHPNSISKDEMNFILGIRNHRSDFDYTYDLPRVSRIFDMLQDFELKQPEALNFKLIDYILEEKSDTTSAKYLFEQLSDRSESSKSFIKAYVDRNIHMDIFINKLCANNKYLWRDVINDPGIPQEREFTYLNYIIKYADVDDIIGLNIDGNNGDDTLTSYILAHEDIVDSIEIDEIGKTICVLDKLDIKFTDIELRDGDDKLKEDIYTNNRYVINEKMLGQFITWKKPELSSEISRKNYSILRDIGFEPVLKYIHENFEDYLNTIIIGVETNVQEGKEAIEDIIERSVVSEHSQCVDAVSKQILVWDDLSDVGKGVQDSDFNEVKDIWDVLLENDRILCNWDNLYHYFNSFGLTETLEEYINLHYEQLDKAVTSDIPVDTFLYEILASSKFETNNFVKLIRSSEIEQYAESLEGLSIEKIKALIDNGYIPFNLEVFQEIRVLAPSLVTDFILHNPKEFVEVIDSIKLENSEINMLLNSEQFDINEKNQIIELYDLDTLAMDDAMIIRDLNFNIDRKATDAAWKLLPVDKKYQLFLNQIASFSNEELPSIFEQFSEIYHQLIERSNHKYTLPYTKYNDELTQKLLEKEYVTSANKHTSGKNNLFGKETITIVGYVKQAKKL